MHKAEDEYLKECQAAGWTVLKNGWPDFLLIREVDGKLVAKAVEVKGVYKHIKSTTRDPLSKAQKDMLEALSKLGIETEVVYRDTERQPGFLPPPKSDAELQDARILRILKRHGLDAAIAARLQIKSRL